MFDTDQQGKGEVLGAGFARIILDTANYPDSDTLTAVVYTLTSGKIARIYIVKLDVEISSDSGKVTNATSLWTSVLADGSINPRYKPGRGIALSTFCAACHTDYMAVSGNDTGIFNRAYRHTTTSDTFTCLRCHFPHGTDVTVMRDARGKNFDEIMSDKVDYPFTGATDRVAAVKKYLIDKNKSSKLKRYTNSSVCLACHGSSLSGIARN
jgi:cytochrome c553